MKKLLSILFTLVIITGTLSANVESLLSSSTARLFNNATDYVIRPNQHFNKMDKDYVIALGDMGLDTGATTKGGSAELGYYRHGAFPFALSTNLLISNTVNTEGEGKISMFDWESLVRFTMGVPDALDLSVGLVMDAEGHDRPGNDSYTLAFSVPVGLQIGPVYNYAHPFFIYTSPNKDAENPVNKGEFNFVFYDKVTFFSLIPGGVETNVWAVAGIDEFDPNLIPYIETPGTPSFGSLDDSSSLGAVINGQIGISNRYDFSPVDSIKLIVNPKFYTDWWINSSGFQLGFTLASDAGIFYRPQGGAFGFFFAMTPGFFFGMEKLKTGYEVENFSTNILWSGRVGVTLYLPNEITMDVACNVNTANNPFEIKVQMTFTL